MKTKQAITSLAIAIAIAFIAGLTGCGDAPVSAKKPTKEKPTKAEWRAKVASRYGELAQMNIIHDWNSADFKSFMGEPSSTQTVGDRAYWYYECSDGTIQLVLRAYYVATGVMSGNINDY